MRKQTEKSQSQLLNDTCSIQQCALSVFLPNKWGSGSCHVHPSLTNCFFIMSTHLCIKNQKKNICIFKSLNAEFIPFGPLKTR